MKNQKERERKRNRNKSNNGKGKIEKRVQEPSRRLPKPIKIIGNLLENSQKRNMKDVPMLQMGMPNRLLGRFVCAIGRQFDTKCVK